MEDWVKHLKQLPKQWVLDIFYHLLLDGKITFAELTEMHTKHLEDLKRGATEEMMNLRSRIISLWCSKKKDRDNELKEIMHYLVDKGQVNMTHQQIDKK